MGNLKQHLKKVVLGVVAVGGLLVSAVPAKADFWIGPTGRIHRGPGGGFTVLRPELYYQYEVASAQQRWYAQAMWQMSLNYNPWRYGFSTRPYAGNDEQEYAAPVKRVRQPEAPVAAASKAQAILKLAKVFMEDKQLADAAEYCEKIVKEYGGTEAAEEAQRLLQEIRAESAAKGRVLAGGQ